jgi:hypothetical protein
VLIWRPTKSAITASLTIHELAFIQSRTVGRASTARRPSTGTSRPGMAMRNVVTRTKVRQ